MIMVAKNFFDS